MPDPEVDQPYISADDLRAAVSGLGDPEADPTDPLIAKFPDALLERLISRFEQMAENYRGVAFTPRAATATLTVPYNTGPAGLLLPHPQVSELTALSYDVGTAPAFGDVLIFDGYRLQLPDSAWWPGGTVVTVAYVHGYATVPAAILSACCEFVRAEAIAAKSNAPKNALSWSDESSGYSYREGTADWSAGRPSKWMAVNDALNEVPDERVPGIA